MNYQDALKIKIGDILHSKDGYTFTVEKIVDESNAANTEHYKRFSGMSSRGIQVNYNHKNIR